MLTYMVILDILYNELRGCNGFDCGLKVGEAIRVKLR